MDRTRLILGVHMINDLYSKEMDKPVGFIESLFIGALKEYRKYDLLIVSHGKAQVASIWTKIKIGLHFRYPTRFELPSNLSRRLSTEVAYKHDTMFMFLDRKTGSFVDSGEYPTIFRTSERSPKFIAAGYTHKGTLHRENGPAIYSLWAEGSHVHAPKIFGSSLLDERICAGWKYHYRQEKADLWSRRDDDQLAQPNFSSLKSFINAQALYFTTNHIDPEEDEDRIRGIFIEGLTTASMMLSGSYNLYAESNIGRTFHNENTINRLGQYYGEVGCSGVMYFRKGDIHRTGGPAHIVRDVVVPHDEIPYSMLSEVWSTGEVESRDMCLDHQQYFTMLSAGFNLEPCTLVSFYKNGDLVDQQMGEYGQLGPDDAESIDMYMSLIGD